MRSEDFTDEQLASCMAYAQEFFAGFMTTTSTGNPFEGVEMEILIIGLIHQFDLALDVVAAKTNLTRDSIDELWPEVVTNAITGAWLARRRDDTKEHA